MATLTSIPLELLVHISSFLPTPDLGALRRTCKQVEKSLYEWFAKEFFAKKQFMLTQPSLQALIDISQHASLPKQVKHLIIGTDQFVDHTMHFQDQERYLRYCQGLADQLTLMNNGIDREMLTAAFENLSNLETIGIRDFNARSRHRDGNAYWTSYGSTTVWQQTGMRPALDYPPHCSAHGSLRRLASHIFSTLIYALSKAGRTPPHFEILLRQPDSGLPDCSFNVPNFMLPTVEPVLQGMKSLLLTLNLKDITRNCSYAPQIPDSSDSCPGLWLRQFLAHTTNLTHLRLNFEKGQTDRNEKFLIWLAQPVSSSPNGTAQSTSTAFSMPAPVALSHLQRLDLGMLTTTPDRLLAAVAKFAPTLKALSIWRMTLHPNKYGHIHLDTKKIVLWSLLFSKLASMPLLSLNHIMVGSLRQITTPQHQHYMDLPVYFPPSGDKRQSDVWNETQTVEYSGKEAKKFLEELAERGDVYWPQTADAEPLSEQDSDGDEEMLDGDGDENEDEDGGDGDEEE